MKYGTIKIPQPAYQHHNERRQKLGQTWEQYINGNAPDTGLPDDLREQLDRIESAATTAEERTNSIQNTLEDMGAGR